MSLCIFIIFLHVIFSSIVLVLGYLQYKYPPKKINYIYGYKSKSSMSGQERWDFANVYYGKLTYKSQLVLIVLILLIGFFIRDKNDDFSIISLGIFVIQFSAMFVSVFLTEIAIKHKFEFKK